MRRPGEGVSRGALQASLRRRIWYNAKPSRSRQARRRRSELSTMSGPFVEVQTTSILSSPGSTCGALARLMPSAMARMAAAAVSSLMMLASAALALLRKLGSCRQASVTTRAPDRAARSRRDGLTFTKPSRTARRKSRHIGTRHPLKPIPLIMRSQPGIAAASSACLSSFSRKRSHTTTLGGP